MALIESIVADHFAGRPDISSVVVEIDTAVFHVGLSVRVMRNIALHGATHGRSKPQDDAEEIAAIADGVLSYLGQIGLMIDELEEHSKVGAKERR